MPSILSIPKKLLRNESGNALLKIESAPGKQTTFVCQFNPDSFHMNASANYHKVKRRGSDSPITQFAGRNNSMLDIKLFFDTSTSYEIKTGRNEKPKKEKAKDVSAYTKVLLSLVSIEGKLHRPPEVTFQWGSFSARGFVENVDVNYTMFEIGGKPVRAEVTLKLLCTEELGMESGKLSHMESPDRSKCIVMTSDSSLWDIAWREYGDASCWRMIAEENHILNPLEIPAGKHLKVPPKIDT